MGDELKVLARNDLEERISATPVLLDGKVYVRTDQHLYAFGVPPGKWSVDLLTSFFPLRTVELARIIHEDVLQTQQLGS